MSHTNFTLSSAEIRKVGRVRLGILSGEEIARLGVCEVTTAETIVQDLPKEGGLLDPRMGTCDDLIACRSCGGNVKECPGHFGKIRLAKPLFHPSFLVTVQKVLNMICFKCGKLKSDVSRAEFKEAILLEKGRDRFLAVYNVCKDIKKCHQTTEEGSDHYKNHGGCGMHQPKFSKEGLRLRHEYSEGETHFSKDLTPQTVIELFQKISREDCENMGFSWEYSRPEWMILTYLMVPPPPVRPSIKHGASQRGEDDLTHKLADVIRTNELIKKFEKQGVTEHQLQDHFELLQYHVATFFNSAIAGVPQATAKGGRPLKSIYQRLKGKEGRVRGNLMGKRVDFSARTVITPDPNVSICEVGVPKSVALTMTTPEMVTPLNIDLMRQLIENGPDEHPGAKFVIADDGTRFDLQYTVDQLKLQYGWIVERHIRDGDVILFNRQPTLHKMSMMGHRIKILPFSTFRLNLSVTTPYNADFDGDEMNLHVPQSYHTKAELEEMMLVSRNLITPQKNRPVIGVVQDSLLGASKITRRDVFLSRDIMMNCLMEIRDWDWKLPIPTILKPEPLWTGKQLISIVFPDGVNLTRFNKLFNRSDPGETDEDISLGDAKVVISRGKLISGIVDRNILGTAGGSLLHIIVNEKGHQVAQVFLDTIQNVINHWLLHNGFTVGIGDTVADNVTMTQIREIIRTAKTDVGRLVEETQSGALSAEPGRTLIESFEAQVNRRLNNAHQDAGTRAKSSLRYTNNVRAMVLAGSKGNEINISQILACVGQVNVFGERIPYGFRRRTLPHFESNDHGPESRGFVENSYLKGLTPQEFFFHAMGGREGLIDTACKTAETGYIQRRLIKSLEDVHVAYDGTVRDAQSNVVQFLYGEDGMDGAKLEMQKFRILDLSDDRFDELYRYDFDMETFEPRPGFGGDFLSESVRGRFADPKSTQFRFAMLRSEYERIRHDQKLLRSEIFRGVNPDRIAQPVNLPRLIQSAQQMYDIDLKVPSEMDPIDVITEVDKLIESIVVVDGNDHLSQEAQQNATLLFAVLLRSTFASKRVLREYRLDELAFDWLLGEIGHVFRTSLAEPGEMVGALAAQSIGEPATQMTLNTFHYAGVSSKNVTLGVPRLKELMNVTRNVKTPILTVYFADHEARKNLKEAETIASGLEFTLLEDVTDTAEIHYDPLDETFQTCIGVDQSFVEFHYNMRDDLNVATLSSWVLRLILNPVQMSDVDIHDIVQRIEVEFGDDIVVLCSDNNDEQLVIRVRVRDDPGKILEEDDEFEDDSVEFLKKVEDCLLKGVVLRGIPSIQKVFHRQVPRIMYGPAGKRSDKDWILETEGVNLIEVLAVPRVDQTRTTSNCVGEILEVFGIEAARKALLDELRNVIEFDGAYVNYRHLSILVDKMTNLGVLTPITRHGVMRSNAGFLMKCSFEQTVEILMNAAQFAEVDAMSGVSANLMHGQLPGIGTGYFDLLLDQQLLANTPMYYNPNPYGDAAEDGLTAPSPYLGANATPYGGSSEFAPSPYVGTGQSPYSPAMTEGGFSPGGPGASSFSPYGGTDNRASPYGDGGGAAGGGSSPTYSPSSPQYSPTSPQYSPTSPQYSPTSPQYSPSSPQYSPSSPHYSPTSPQYSPTSPQHGGGASPQYSPSSPQYSPSSPQYSPSSPQYSPSSPQYSPSSPQYSPSSPQYSPSSPQYSPSSPQYSPSSPQYSPSSPQYSPSSPQYTASSPTYSPSSPTYSASSPRQDQDDD